MAIFFKKAVPKIKENKTYTCIDSVNKFEV